MIDQVELHKLAQSKDRYERKRVVSKFCFNFADLPNKQLAWNDLIRLTLDKDTMRHNAAFAIKIAFSHLPEEHKKQAWDDMHRLSTHEDDYIRWIATSAIGTAFSFIPEEYKKQAWDDLHRLSMDEDDYIRAEATSAIGTAFSFIPDEHKKQAWDDIHRLSMDKGKYIGGRIKDAIKIAFSHLPEEHKKQAWGDLIRLTTDKYRNCWSYEPAFGIVFSFIPEEYKKQAWDDMHRLSMDEDDHIRAEATSAIGTAFSFIPEEHKKQAWNDIHRLSMDEDDHIRAEATSVIGTAFFFIPEEHKKLAWDDIHRLSMDNNFFVLESFVSIIGTAFSYIPAEHKKQAWNDMRRLSKHGHEDLRAYAFHSMGKASIFEATRAESTDEFKKKIEKAIRCFKKSSYQGMFYHPSRFCLPFYRSFYTLTFKNEEVAKVQKYLDEAKDFVHGSKNRERLLEAIENLGNALKEVQNLNEKNFEAVKCDLNAYRRYCERATDLLETTEEKAPGATRLIKKGLPMIDERIQEMIAEIQEKANTLCKQTKGTPLEDLGKDINRHGQALLQIRDPIGLEKGIDYMQVTLSAICAKMPEEERGEACKLLKKASEELYIEDKVYLVNIILSKIHLNVEMITEHVKLYKKLIDVNESVNRIERKTDKIIGYVQKIETSCDRIIYDLEKAGVKLKDEDKEELKTLAKDLVRANKEQLTNFTNELIKLMNDPDLQRKIEREAPKGLKSKVKITVSKITEMLNELGIALGAAVTAEELLPHIEAIMREITILSGITPGIASTLLLIPLIALKMKTIE